MTESTETTEPTPATEPVPASPPAAPANWREAAGLDVDMQSNPSLEKFDGVPALAKSYVELQSMIGGRVAVPGEDAKPEEWNKFYAAMGRPETTAGYEMDKWAPPEGLPWDGEFAKAMMGAMHEEGLSTKQAQGLLNKYANMQADQWAGLQEADGQATEAAIEALKKKYGAAYPVKLDLAKRTLNHFGGGDGDLFDRLVLQDGTQVGNHPKIIEMFAAIGEAMSEDGTLPPGGRVRTTLTPDEANLELSKIHAEKFDILNKKEHPEHEILMARKTALEKMIHGGDSA